MKKEAQFEFRIPRVSRRLALVQLARFNEVHSTDGVAVDVTNLNYFCPSPSLTVFVSLQLSPLVFSYLQDKDISLSFDLLLFLLPFLIVAIKESYLAEVHTKIAFLVKCFFSFPLCYLCKYFVYMSSLSPSIHST